MHGLEDGDYVTFSEVKGMTELNGIEPLKITVKSWFYVFFLNRIQIIKHNGLGFIYLIPD